MLLFRVHWFTGLVTGALLVVVALSGAMLTFREEITDAIDPNGRTVAPSMAPVLSPPELLRRTAAAFPLESIGTLTTYAKPGAATRVVFEPPKGLEHGRTLYLDPYTSRPLPALQSADFFTWVESLHRWLLLKRDAGRITTGILVASLLVMLSTGPYLRWPRRHARGWRIWLTIEPKTNGRRYLHALHALIGTLAVPTLLLAAVTGLYWAFDGVRAQVDALVGESRATRAPDSAKTRSRRPPGWVQWRRANPDASTSNPPG